MKTILYRLFGVGKFPGSLLSELKNERIIASEEGARSTITYIDFRAPGRYSNWRRSWITGGILLTDKRLVLLKYSQVVVNILLTDERVQQMRISCEADDRLLLAFHPALFLENSSGQIEWRFRSSQAQFFAETLNKR